MMKKLFLGFLFSTSLLTQVQAGLVAEPSLGYSIIGDTKVSNNTAKGPQLGLALGYQEVGFVGGLKYVHSFITEKDPTLSLSGYHKNDFGLYAGYNFPILLRAWAAYYFVSDMTLPTNGTISGSTIEIGVGYQVIPMLSLNLEYRHYNESSVQVGSTNYPVIGNNVINEVVLGVSAPINF